ncbi:hypothetical protein ACLOJK_009938 [Asimina triloba]
MIDDSTLLICKAATDKSIHQQRDPTAFKIVQDSFRPVKSWQPMEGQAELIDGDHVMAIVVEVAKDMEQRQPASAKFTLDKKFSSTIFRSNRTLHIRSAKFDG